MLLYVLLALAAGSICAMAIVVAAAMRSSQISQRVDGQVGGSYPQPAPRSKSELVEQPIFFTAPTEDGEEHPERDPRV